MNFFDSFTKGAKRVLEIAQEEAQRLGHNYVGTEHLLLGCIREKTSVTTLLAQLGVTFARACEEVEQLVGKGDFNFSDAFGYTPRTKHVLVVSREEANALGQNYVGVEHILFGLLKEHECVGNRILRALGVDTEELYRKMIEATRRELGKQDKSGAQSPAAKGSAPESGKGESGESAPTLMQYGRDLTAAAKNGELDPVIGRSEEM